MHDVISILVSAESKEQAEDKAFKTMMEIKEDLSCDYFVDDPVDIIRGDDPKFRQEMIKLCKERKYQYWRYKQLMKNHNQISIKYLYKSLVLRLLIGSITTHTSYYDATMYSAAFENMTLTSIKNKPDRYYLVNFQYHKE